MPLFHRRSINQINLLGAVSAGLLLLLFSLYIIFTEMQYSKNDYARINDIFFTVLTAALAVIVVVGLISNFLSWVIKKDFERLTSFLGEVPENFTPIYVEHLSIEEFRLFAEHANAMGREIVKRQVALEELNSQLEEKITEKTALLEKQNSELSVSKQHAEELLALLDRFIKNAIHEINTPLAIIQTNLDLLGMRCEPNKNIQNIEAAVKILTTVYEDLTYYVKKERMVRKKEVLNFSQFLSLRLEFFDDIIRCNAIKIDVDIEHELFIQFDKTQLGRLIDNTLSNAVKYAIEKSVINVKLYRDERFIVYEISNESYEEVDCERIFERYYRQDDTKGGFGIGLNLVMYICVENSVLIATTCENKRVTFSYRFVNVYDDMEHILSYI